MLAAYGVDVQGTGLSNRRLKVLLDRLPTYARPSADPMAQWSTEAHLLAAVFDSLQALTYVTVKAANPKNNPPKPKPLPRPGSRNPNAPRKRPQGSGWADVLKALTGTKGVSVNGK